jgi:hypothetical protein
LDAAAAKELAEAKIVTAQTLMGLHENDGLEAAASFRLQPQKLSEHYNLGDFGYLVGQCGSIPLEHIDEHGRMIYHLSQEDARGKRRSLDDNAWWDPPNADDEKDHFGFGSPNDDKQASAQKPADENNVIILSCTTSNLSFDWSDHGTIANKARTSRFRGSEIPAHTW